MPTTPDPTGNPHPPGSPGVPEKPQPATTKKPAPKAPEPTLAEIEEYKRSQGHD